MDDILLTPGVQNRLDSNSNMPLGLSPPVPPPPPPPGWEKRQKQTLTLVDTNSGQLPIGHCRYMKLLWNKCIG